MIIGNMECSDATVSEPLTQMPPDFAGKMRIIQEKLKYVMCEVDFYEIAQMTEKTVVKYDWFGPASVGYYSADDLSNALDEACRMAGGVKDDKGRYVCMIPLTREMLEAAFKKFPPSITKEALERFVNLQKE